MTAPDPTAPPRPRRAGGVSDIRSTTAAGRRAAVIEADGPAPIDEHREIASATEVTEVPPIVVEDLTKTFGRVRAVDQLSFTVEPGRITGFLGPNGAGKSTTLRILLSLVSATAGSATFGGISYADLPEPQHRVGAVLEPAFHPGRTGRDHLWVLAPTAGADAERIDQLLELVGMTAAADRRVGGYSLGMRQRLALAAALLGDPDYLILDEPANGLDPEGIRWLRGFLRAFVAPGRVVLMSSHILNEVEATVDDVVVINNGRLIRQAPMRELSTERAGIRVRVPDVTAAGQVLDELGMSWRQAEDPAGAYLQVEGAELATVGKALFEAGLPVLELADLQVDLEAEFFALLGGQQ
jgi:ABC-2 type transport system ATP-binding protein